jgi:hypothetical protein
MARQTNPKLLADFFNKIGQTPPNNDVRVTSVRPSISDIALHRRERRNGARKRHPAQPRSAPGQTNASSMFRTDGRTSRANLRPEG